MPKSNPLIDPSLAIVFAYAPAGLGHLRVTDALRHGLPKEAQPILLPAQEQSIRFIHRLTSINPTLRRFMEWSQRGKPEVLFTKGYRKLLLSDAKEMEQQLYDILKQRVDLPRTLLLIASHFGIAHQVGAIKKQLEERANVRVILVVQVTDDSPQSIWYVPGADITFVPSELTKEILLEYGKDHHLSLIKIEVNPYPVSLHLGEELRAIELSFRKAQMRSDSEVPIHFVVPVSGAAVGTMFASDMMRFLHRKSKRFHFHLIAKRNIFGDVFISQMQKKHYVSSYSSHSDRQIVELYESAYTQAVIGFEITKPSEQAFKALLCSKQRGGSILLFSTPVGRQEYDNLAFLRRHFLIPTNEEQQLLFEIAAKKEKLSDAQRNRLFPRATTWRGVRIPDDAKSAAEFFWWCFEEGIFSNMHECYSCPRGDDSCEHELGSDGVVRFWERVQKMLSV